MNMLRFINIFAIILGLSLAQEIYETDMNFRVDPGARTCFFEKGASGQILEAKYQVTDGQHGDYDITFEVIDPKGRIIVSDYKQSHNSVIIDLSESGDYVFCLDNTHSVLNSKLVFVYVMIEDKVKDDGEEVTVSTTTEDGKEVVENEVLEWMGHYENGEPYYVEVKHIAESVTRTLRHVVKARQALNMYGAIKSRDSYMAFEDTFIVDMWSSFQISFMILVGTVQVYMIKKLFNTSNSVKKDSRY